MTNQKQLVFKKEQYKIKHACTFKSFFLNMHVLLIFFLKRPMILRGSFTYMIQIILYHYSQMVRHSVCAKQEIEFPIPVFLTDKE